MGVTEGNPDYCEGGSSTQVNIDAQNARIVADLVGRIRLFSAPDDDDDK